MVRTNILANNPGIIPDIAFVSWKHYHGIGTRRDQQLKVSESGPVAKRAMCSCTKLGIRISHAYDASRRALRMRVGRAEQLSEILHCWFSGTIPGLWRLSYVLSTFELFLVLFLLSWLLRWTDQLRFFLCQSR